jgi:hypothetical protein
VSRLNGAAPPDPLDDLDEVIAELEGNEWEVISEVTENHWHLPKGTVVDADASGKMRAVSAPDLEVTRTDNARAKQDSLAERALGAVPEVIERVKTPAQAWVAVVIVVCLTGLAVVYLLYG